jgi:hypothetical protein
MGAYKGRVNLKQRRRRFAKAKRIKATTRSEPLRNPAASNKGTSLERKSSKPDDDAADTEDISLDKTEGDELVVEKEDAEET